MYPAPILMMALMPLLGGTIEDENQANKQWAQKFLPVLVRIEKTLPDGSRAFGTGFICDPAGHIVTNYHVVRKASQIKVFPASGRGEGKDVLTLAVVDSKLDLAILDPPASFKPEGVLDPRLGLDTTKDLASREIMVISQADNVPNGTSYGHVSAEPVLNAEWALQRAFPGRPFPYHKEYNFLLFDKGLVTHGSSGAPVIDRASGKPVSMVVGGVGLTGSFGVGLPWELVREAISRIGKQPSISMAELLGNKSGAYEKDDDKYYPREKGSGALYEGFFESPQTEPVDGTVVDSVSSDPVASARILLKGVPKGCFGEQAGSLDCRLRREYATTTDTYGNFQLNIPLEDLEWQLFALHQVYETEASAVFSALHPVELTLHLRRKPQYSRDLNMFFIPRQVALSTGEKKVRPRSWIREMKWKIEATSNVDWLELRGKKEGKTTRPEEAILRRKPEAQVDDDSAVVTFQFKDESEEGSEEVTVYADSPPAEEVVAISGHVNVPRAKACVAAFRGITRISDVVETDSHGNFTVDLSRSELELGGVVLKAISPRCHRNDEGVPVSLSTGDELIEVNLEQKTCVKPQGW